MNFLGHALISLTLDEAQQRHTLYGNFAGDFYKGPLADLALPAALREGVRLHRIIDRLSDRADNPLYPLLDGFGRYKGIVADMFIDHFLCREFQQLFRQDLHIVATDILHRVARYRPHFPDAFAPHLRLARHRTDAVPLRRPRRPHPGLCRYRTTTAAGRYPHHRHRRAGSK